jgi:hypothetical protein
MEFLASRILLELKTAPHYAVYEKTLSLVWPMPDKKRKAKITRFADRHRLRLAFYRAGLCAIFVSDVSHKR